MSNLFNISRSLPLAGLVGGFMIASSSLAGAPALDVVTYSGLANSPPGFPGLFWNLSSGMSSPVIDNSGKIAFQGTIFGDGVIISNNKVLWYGDNTGWTVVARSGTTTLPGMAGLSLTSIAGSPALAPNGLLTLSGKFVVGGAVTSTNDSAFWNGPAATPGFVARESTTTLPGGAALSADFAFGSTPPTNNAGQVLFSSALTGGDVSGTINNSGVFLGTTSGITTVWRKGDPIPGAPALPDPSGPFMTPDTFGLNLNGSGEVASTGTLVAGTAGGVTTADDKVVYTTVGGSPRIVARENAAIPGLTGVTYKTATSFGMATRALNNSGKIIFNATFAGTGVTTTNDTGWLVDDHGAVSMVVREGDTIAGETFNFAQTSGGMELNNNNHVVIVGTSTATSNASRIWTGPIGGPYVLVVAQGQLAPGFTDVSINFNASGGNIAFNNSDQIVFSCPLSGAGVSTGINDGGLFAWDATNGLRMIARTGVTVIPGILDVAQFALLGSTGQNGEGGCYNLSDNGWFVFRVQDVKGFQAIVRTQPFTAVACPADINGDHSVGVADLLTVISNWGVCPNPSNCPSDLNNDDTVGVADLLAVISAWGACP